MTARRRDIAPRLDPISLPDLAAGNAADLRPGARRDAERYERLEVSGADLTAIVLDGCEIDGAVADDAVLDGSRMVESVVAGLRASTLRAKGWICRDVRLERSRIGAAECFDSEWTAVELVSCRIGYLGLSGSRLRDVRFLDCSFDELDLRDAAVTRVSVAACRIDLLDVVDARLDGLDLRGAQLGGVDAATALRGAVIDGAQLSALAPLLASAAGITVG